MPDTPPDHDRESENDLAHRGAYDDASPRPWTVEVIPANSDRPGWPTRLVRAADGSIVAEMRGRHDHPVPTADAALIVAAVLALDASAPPDRDDLPAEFGPNPPQDAARLAEWIRLGWIYKADPRDLAQTIGRLLHAHEEIPPTDYEAISKRLEVLAANVECRYPVNYVAAIAFDPAWPSEPPRLLAEIDGSTYVLRIVGRV